MTAGSALIERRYRKRHDEWRDGDVVAGRRRGPDNLHRVGSKGSTRSQDSHPFDLRVR